MVSRRGRSGWLGLRTNFEKTLMSISLLLLITLVLVILFGISYRGFSSDDVEETVCNSKECIKTAGEMLGMMDPGADPCSDFYSYACGGYSQRPFVTSVAQTSADTVWARLKRDLESHSTNNSPSAEKVKVLYNTCMNSESYPKEIEKTMEALMAEVGLGSWPLLDKGYWDESEVTTDKKLLALTLLGIDVGFRIEIIPDPLKPGAYINKIYPGGPLNVTEDVRNKQNLKSYLKKVLELLGLEEFKASTDMNDILSIETYLHSIRANVSCAPHQLTDTLPPEDSLRDLRRIIPNVDWTVIMNGLWKAANVTGPVAFEIHCREQIREYLDYLATVPSFKSTYNYLGWRFLFHFRNQLGPAFRLLQLYYDVKEDQGAQPLYRAQWRHCLQVLERYVAPLLAQVLVKEDVDEQVQEQVEIMTKNMKNTLDAFITSSSWISDPYDSRIKQKLAEVKFAVPTADSNKIHQWFNQMDIDTNLFVRNVIRLQQSMVVLQLREHLMKEDHIRFDDFEQITPKTFHYQGNYLGLYLDKIREPFFRKDQPRLLTYSGLGTFLGQQLSWYILEQNVGVSADDHVLLWDLWASNNNASSCILNKFSQYLTNGRNGKDHLTKEAFVDYNSLYMSYSLFKSSEEKDQSLPGFELSNDQMFFLAYTQTFCEGEEPASDASNIPTKLRINSALGSMKEFSTAYNCAVSTPMNPPKKCHLWR